ncbi:MAG TPA: NAD-dependent epimerase/dehydratase family protein [Chthoniobacterales bacterium]
MKILLTGATGFVGRNLLLRLLREEKVARVIAAVRNPLKLRGQLKHEGFAEIPAKLDILRAEAPEWEWDSREITHAIHSAGLISAARRDDYFRTNSHGTLRLLERLPPHLPTVILSSQAAAGPTPDGKPARAETDPAAPCTWYGESKWEMETRVLAQFPDRPILFLRPPMVLGPRDTATLPLFRLARSPLRVKPGFAAKAFSWIGVGDLCAAIQQALAGPFPSRAYFVASEGVVSDAQLIEAAGRAIRRRGIILPVPIPLLQGAAAVIGRHPGWSEKIPNLTPDRVRDLLANRWVVDGSAFTRDFSWKPADQLAATLQTTAEWYRAQGLLAF